MRNDIDQLIYFVQFSGIGKQVRDAKGDYNQDGGALTGAVQESRHLSPIRIIAEW